MVVIVVPIYSCS